MENPAHKLYSLLDQAYSECKLSVSSPSFKKTWGTVLEVNPNETSELIASFSSMLNLFQTTKEYIKNNERLNTTKNLNFLRSIEKALYSINFDGNMSSFTQHLDKETLTALYYMGENMNFIYDLNETTIDSEEINSLVNEVNELIDNITTANLPEEVKTILFTNLNNIRTSLISYKVSGIEGMKTALEQTIGSLFMNNEVITPVAQDENVKGVFNIIDKMNTVLSTGVAVKDLVGPIMGLLLK